MKRLIHIPLLLLMVVVLLSACQAERRTLRIALVDTGVSTNAISPRNIVAGHNYVQNNSTTEDKSGHGTAIAAIIVGSEPANIAGICPDAVIVPLVYYDKDENGETVKGDVDVMARIIRDAVDTYDCDIISISSGTTTNSSALKEAVNYAEEKGVLVVSCSGNSNKTNPELIYLPGGYDTVLCVGSVNPDGSVSSFSQRGDAVDLLAPGSALRVASKNGKTIRAEGTSYSTAYVSGAAAALLDIYPKLTPARLRDILCSSAVDVGASGHDANSGWGVLNLAAALALAEQKNTA